MGMLGLVLAATLAAAPATAPDAENAAAEAAGKSWVRQVAAALGHSNSPRDRALSTRLIEFDAWNDPKDRVRRGQVLREAAESAPNDRLVQLMWAQAAEEASGCDLAQPCPDRAAGFAHIEPDNSAAWLPVLQKAEHEHNEQLAKSALDNIAKASHHDGLFAESVDAWMTVLERYPMAAAVRRLSERYLEAEGVRPGPGSAHAAEAVMAIAYSAMLPMPPPEFFRRCRPAISLSESAEPAKDCQRLGELMADAPTMSERRLGLALLRGSDERRALEGYRQLDWVQWHYLPKPYGAGGVMEDMDAYITDLRSTGSEIRAVELSLQRQGIAITPPAGWQKPKPILPPTPPAEER